MEHAERPIAVVDNAAEALSTEILSSHGREALKNITFGSIAGMVGKVIEYPFDTVKVRLQSQPDHMPLLYKGPLDCFKKSLKKDGFIGIYRGISAPMIGAAVENSCLFFSYRIAQDALQSTFYQKDDPLPMRALLFCGAVSGAFTSLFLTPIELIKCKIQVPLETPGMVTAKPGMLHLITSVYRHQGILGFWRGQMGTFIRETGGSAAWFGSYEGTSLLFRKIRDEPADAALPVYQRLIAGATAGMSYNFIFYPADTVKSRMQTEDVARNAGGKQSFWTVTKALWQQQGLKGMYRGCGITVARSAPSSALIFTVHDILMRRFA